MFSLWLKNLSDEWVPSGTYDCRWEAVDEGKYAVEHFSYLAWEVREENELRRPVVGALSPDQESRGT